GHDQVAFELPHDYEQLMNLDEGADKLLERMDRVGTQYMITYTPELPSGLLDAGFSELRAVDLQGFEWHGRFRADQTFTLRLFEAPDKIARITPDVALEREPNKLSFQSFKARGGQRYLLKYSHYRGWKVTDTNGKELLVEDARPGMWITVPQDTTVQLRYSWWHYFTR
ncbi:MAG: hypothetical protein ACYTKC_22185, partial [Planctomycetota bacterium]